LDPEINKIDRQSLNKNSIRNENDFKNESNSNISKSLLNKKTGNGNLENNLNMNLDLNLHDQNGK
jgi:hypothetical protein